MNIYGILTVRKVNKIYDGDTFRCDIKWVHQVIGDDMPIRISGIDTPELNGDSDVEKELAITAKKLTATILNSANVIELHRVRRGSFFRLLADVYCDGHRLSDELIAHGLAIPYQKGKNTYDWSKGGPKKLGSGNFQKS